MAVIGLLLLILNRVGRRVLDGRTGSRPTITVRHQQRLDRHTSVTLVTAGERNLLIGTSSQSIVLLAEGEDLATRDPVPADDEPAATLDVGTGGRINPIRALQNRTVRRG
jgi:flagellar biogenesis protein FliO